MRLFCRELPIKRLMFSFLPNEMLSEHGFRHIRSLSARGTEQMFVYLRKFHPFSVSQENAHHSQPSRVARASPGSTSLTWQGVVPFSRPYTLSPPLVDLAGAAA
jgi:hypothetical protein